MMLGCGWGLGLGVCKKIWNNSTIWWWFCNVTQGIDWDPVNLRTKPSAWFGRPQYVDRTVFMTNSDVHRVLVGPSALRQWPSGPINDIWWWYCNVTQGIDWDPVNLRTKPSTWFGRPDYVGRTVFMTNAEYLSGLRPSGPINDISIP